MKILEDLSRDILFFLNRSKMSSSKNIVVSPEEYLMSSEKVPLVFPYPGGETRPPFSIELSVCKVPASIRRDVLSVFPDAGDFLKQHPGWYQTDYFQLYFQRIFCLFIVLATF